MDNVERNGHLDDAQYGGRKRREAIAATTIKILNIEICPLQQLNAAFTDCNAKKCYDRIMPFINVLLETKAGAPEQITKRFATLLAMLFHQ